MKIYTKTGDSGETSLIGRPRVHKNDARIEAVGTLALERSVAFLVTTDGEQLLDVAAVSADHGVILIPRAYAQGFLGIE